MEEIDEKDVYFATYDNPFDDSMRSFTNKEFRLNLGNRMVMPDFFVPSTKKIIEFDGDYWHSERVANPTNERER